MKKKTIVQPKKVAATKKKTATPKKKATPQEPLKASVPLEQLYSTEEIQEPVEILSDITGPILDYTSVNEVARTMVEVQSDILEAQLVEANTKDNPVLKAMLDANENAEFPDRDDNYGSLHSRLKGFSGFYDELSEVENNTAPDAYEKEKSYQTLVDPVALSRMNPNKTTEPKKQLNVKSESVEGVDPFISSIANTNPELAEYLSKYKEAFDNLKRFKIN